MQCWTVQSWTDYSVVGLALCWPATLYSVQESVLTQSHIKLVCTCKIIAIYYWRLTFKLKLTVLAQHPFNDIKLMSTAFRVLLPKFRFSYKVAIGFSFIFMEESYNFQSHGCELHSVFSPDVSVDISCFMECVQHGFNSMKLSKISINIRQKVFKDRMWL